jgi:hypothetical protein
MAIKHGSVSVIEPVAPAIERVKWLLFRPFDFGRWFTIGFCAWLASLSHGGCYFRLPPGLSGPKTPVPSWLPPFQNIAAMKLVVFLLIASIAFVVGLTLAIVLLWLSSRGRFMFLYCLATNKAEVKTPWRRFAGRANSLFLFRLLAGVIFFVFIAMFAGAAALLVLLFRRGLFEISVIAIAGIVLLALFLVAGALAFALMLKLTHDFVVPIMYLTGSTCVEAWAHFMTCLSANKGRFALYILFQFVIALAMGAIVSAAVIITCCCAGLLMAIPYIGAVLMLPLLVFQRAYSVYYLRQYGPAFDVFAPAPTGSEPIVH